MKRFSYSWFAIIGAGSDNEDFGSNDGYIVAETAEEAEEMIRANVEEIWDGATITIDIEEIDEAVETGDSQYA
jgi:hypothetical protein